MKIFKNLLKTTILNLTKKAGFEANHSEDNAYKIFTNNILLHLKNFSEYKNQKVLDIGCSCSKPCLDFIEFCKTKNQDFFLIDSKEQPSQLLKGNFTKINAKFPNDEKMSSIFQGIFQCDYCLLSYSLCFFYNQNFFEFLDKAVSLLSTSGGVVNW
ncbi:MAG: hypothetical protein ACPLKS_04160 [Caldisericum exile]|uniref:hypothetical protein n=1 Tax=Caldisericum exile TaxID=693075 RepID=UPI003C76F155